MLSFVPYFIGQKSNKKVKIWKKKKIIRKKTVVGISLLLTFISYTKLPWFRQLRSYEILI